MIANRLEQALRDAVSKTNLVATSQVQKKAASKGWPVATARSLRVDITSDEQISMGEEAQDLEYGGISQAPNPAVRDLDESLLSDTFTEVLRAEFSRRGVVL